MASTVEPTLRLSEHKGCGIRAFSYQAGSGEWVPEACFWLYTADGWRRLWIKSFERFFAAPDITFFTQKEADDFAFRLARLLIDRTLTDLQETTQPRMAALPIYLSKIWQSERPFSVSVASIIKQIRSRV
jgi:hypothetical protein